MLDYFELPECLRLLGEQFVVVADDAERLRHALFCAMQFSNGCRFTGHQCTRDQCKCVEGFRDFVGIADALRSGEKP